MRRKERIGEWLKECTLKEMDLAPTKFIFSTLLSRIQ
jgi:hypothetical protein